MPNLLKITTQEWLKAKKYFAMKPNEVKMKKTGKAGSHSFIKVNDKLYAMATHAYLGKGNFNRVKLVQKENGKNYKVNIHGKKNIFEKSEIAILRLLNFYKGEATRKLAVKKEFWKITKKGKDGKPAPFLTDKISYKVLRYLEGRSLQDELEHNKELNPTQKLIIAFKSAQALEDLYKTYRILHNDIKPDNIIVNVEKNYIQVFLTDFGLSKILAAKKRSYDNCRGNGTKEFRAPEIEAIEGDANAKGSYSHGSDIYALGMTFKKLGISKLITSKMLSVLPSHRPSLKKVMFALAMELAKKPQRGLNLPDILNIETISEPPLAQYVEKYQDHLNLQVYNELLRFIKIAHRNKNSDTSKEQALKLTVLFGNPKSAIQYLSLKPFSLDALCQFDLPPIDQCLFTIWQDFAKKQNYMHNPKFRQLLGNAHQIEKMIIQGLRKAKADKSKPDMVAIDKKRTQILAATCESAKLSKKCLILTKKQEAELEKLNRQIKKLQNELVDLSAGLPLGKLDVLILDAYHQQYLNKKNKPAKKSSESKNYLINYSRKNASSTPEPLLKQKKTCSIKSKNRL